MPSKEMQSTQPKNKVVAVIVAYHPDLKILQENIRAASSQVLKLYIWDNTGLGSPLARLDLPDNVIYIPSDENVGIATPLNKIGLLAATTGFEWMLTLDQDSTLPVDYVAKVLGKLEQLSEASKVGIVSGAHELLNPSLDLIDASRVKTLITSGSLIYLPAYKDIDGCDEEFFIDCVDHELALKMRRHGWQLWRFNRVRFSHSIGEPKEVVVPMIGKKLCCSNHSALRKYYATRNRIRLYTRYFMFDPLFCLRDIYAMFAESAKILLFENAKASKIRAMGLGIVDAINGVGGSCKHRI